jgi:hypothetical protein
MWAREFLDAVARCQEVAVLNQQEMTADISRGRPTVVFEYPDLLTIRTGLSNAEVHARLMGMYGDDVGDVGSVSRELNGETTWAAPKVVPYLRALGASPLSLVDTSARSAAWDACLVRMASLYIEAPQQALVVGMALVPALELLIHEHRLDPENGRRRLTRVVTALEREHDMQAWRNLFDRFTQPPG